MFLGVFMKHGIEQLSSLIVSTGKITTELKKFSDVNFSEIKNEALNLDSSEREELSAEFAKVLDLPNDSIEANIEKGFDFLLLSVEIAAKFFPTK